VTPPTPFVVLTFPRSGSAWLNDQLNSHPEIVAYAELFLRDAGVATASGIEVPSFEVFLAGIPQPARSLLVVQRVRYLRRLYAGRPGLRAVGFKLMYKQARDNRGVFPYFAARRVRAVHLVRANLLEAVVSYEVARTTGSFHPRRGDPVRTESVTLDAARLRQRLEHQEQAVSWGRSQLERFRLPRLEIAHEELIGRREETLGRVLDFLGIASPATPLESSLVPVTLGSGLDFVANADEVRAALARTRFEWMLGRRPR
jgi:LPS sulfotransferase NodH